MEDLELEKINLDQLLKTLILDIPKGTVVYDDISNDELLDCCDENATYVIAKGGDGGQGNARFKSSTNQAPRKFTSRL